MILHSKKCVKLTNLGTVGKIPKITDLLTILNRYNIGISHTLVVVVHFCVKSPIPCIHVATTATPRGVESTDFMLCKGAAIPEKI